MKGPLRGQGAVGKWTDAATGEHGDLLDLIQINRNLGSLKATLDEARAFLNMPKPERAPPVARERVAPNSEDVARRLFAAGQPIFGTVAHTYLKGRGLDLHDTSPLRFHPSCNCREDDGSFSKRPALLAATTNARGTITGVHRIYLTPQGQKAPLEEPKRMLGLFLGSGVSFGKVREVLVVGEGIESMLALQTLLPHLLVMAAVSAAHLPSVPLPQGLKRLYIAADNDTAGEAAAARLLERAHHMGLEVHLVWSSAKDWNDDLKDFPRALAKSNALQQLDEVDWGTQSA